MGKQSQKLSSRREDAVSGGGIDGALATVSEAEYVQEYDYGGTLKGKTQAALRLVYEAEGLKKPWEQHHSVGPSEKYEVEDDGDTITSKAKSGGFVKSSNVRLFFDNLQDAIEKQGLDIDDYMPEDGSVAPLRGLSVRLGMIQYETAGGDQKEMPVITEIVVEGAKKANGKANGKVAAKSSKDDDEEDVETKTEHVISALIEEHTSVKKGDLGRRVADAARKDSDVRAMTQLAMKESWVADEDRPWSFDKKKGILRAQEEQEDE